MWVMSTPTPAAPTSMTIGEVARSAGISIDTLRFYDRTGLLGDLPRNTSGHRIFDEAALGLLDVVIRLRRTAMPVEEIRAFVDLVRADGEVGPRIALLNEHRARVVKQLQQLKRDLAVIDWKITAYTALAEGSAPPPPPSGWPELPEGPRTSVEDNSHD